MLSPVGTTAKCAKRCACGVAWGVLTRSVITMKLATISLGLSLLSGLTLAACADSTDTVTCDQPGDIDCAGGGDSGGGKADGWDYKNDPAQMSQHLTYKLADLPKSGDRTKPFWKDQYPEA